MKESDKRAIRMAIQALNEHGADAADYFNEVLQLPGNEDADAWLASLWEPINTNPSYSQSVH